MTHDENYRLQQELVERGKVIKHQKIEIEMLTRQLNTHDNRVPVEKRLYEAFKETLVIYAKAGRRPSKVADEMADRLKQCVDEITAYIKSVEEQSDEPAPYMKAEIGSDGIVKYTSLPEKPASCLLRPELNGYNDTKAADEPVTAAPVMPRLDASDAKTTEDD